MNDCPSTTENMAKESNNDNLERKAGGEECHRWVGGKGFFSNHGFAFYSEIQSSNGNSIVNNGSSKAGDSL